VLNQGVLKIADLGSATYLSKEYEIEGFTRWYKAPEMLFGSRSYDMTVDMWGFACVIAEVMQGWPVFVSMNEIE